jgi:hypothetical protein
MAVAVTGEDDPEAAARKELAPRSVTFSKRMLPLQDALAELARATGNRVGDTRRQKTNPMVPLPAGATSFWPALDAIGKASGIGFSPYLAEAGVALTDTPYRPVPTAYAGIFRVAARRRGVNLDEETQTRHCQVALDIAWEPRFRPFYLDLRQVKLTFAPDAKKKVLEDKAAGRGAVHVAGRSAIELEGLSAAPDRTCPKIASLQATLWAVGPSKMLTFTFNKLGVQKPGEKPSVPLQAIQEGVTVRIMSIRRQADVLLVKVDIENPKGSPGFESHQSWLDNNRIVLRQDAGNKRALVPTGSQENLKGRRAEVTYEFAESGGQPLPATLDGWSLRYETPGRIVELTAPFTLTELVLP